MAPRPNRQRAIVVVMTFILVVTLLLGFDATSSDQLTAIKVDAEAGRLADAERQARQYVALHVESPDGRFLLGYILFRESKARESLAEYTAGAKYKQPSAADLRVVASDYVLLGAYGDADKWFTKATEFEPQNALGWYYLGRTKYHENRFEEAVSAFHHCLRLSPKHVRAEDNLGLSWQALGRTDDARQAFVTAIAWQREAQDGDPWPSIDFGAFLLENNQVAEAVPHLQHAIELAPNIPQAHQFIGKAYLALLEFPLAQTELEQAVRLGPKNARAHYVLGQLYEKQGQREKARREFALYSQLNAAHVENEKPQSSTPLQK